MENQGASNVRVETITRNDNVEEYEEITAAVERKLDERIKAAEEKTTFTIQEAIKRALEKKSLQAGPSNKRKKEPDFRLKGNKKRYEVNEEVIEQIDSAIEEIDSQQMESAKAKLEAGKAILLKQQKLIRLADREENGWEVAKHYMSDDLASDSADEKAIKKARKEALASINKRKAKRKLDFRSKSKRGQRDEIPRTSWYSRARNERSYDRTYERKKTSICFRCGREGHWQNS